jgi:hypothetical protein
MMINAMEMILQQAFGSQLLLRDHVNKDTPSPANLRFLELGFKNF